MYRPRITSFKTVVLAGIFGLLASAPAMAQTQEGTTIRNIASVTFTDANSNAYAAVADTVDIIVGFAAGINVTGPGSATPAAGSNGNTLTLQIHNNANGVDTVSVSASATLVTITDYVYNSTTYGTLAALNAALAAVEITSGDSIAVDVIYDVPAGSGGQSGDVTLTATSIRDGAEFDTEVTAINPAQSAGVAVTPDGGQNLSQLPNSGSVPTYSFDFVVKNIGNGTDDFDLVASNVNPAVITNIVSVNGVAGTTTTINNIAAGDSLIVAVVYTVGSAAGSADTMYLAATSVADNAQIDSGYVDMTVVQPALDIVKTAFRDDGSTPIGAGTVVPGEFIRYRITVTNLGAGDATSVHVDDTLHAALTHIANLDPGGDGWTFSANGVSDVDADLPTPLAGSASAEFWIRAQVN